MAKYSLWQWGPSSPPPKADRAPIFGPWPNDWMDQDANGYEGRPRPRPHCVTWGPSYPSQKGHNPSPNFQPTSIVAKRSPISATAEYLLTIWWLSLAWLPDSIRASKCPHIVQWGEKIIRISASVRHFLFVKTNLRHASSVTCVPAGAFLFPKKHCE